MADDCPTCRAVEALLIGSRRVPRPVAKKIARSSATRRADKALRRTKTVRKASEYQKKLSKHLKKEREKATKKNGQFKKGMNMAKVMAKAHKCVKREMK
jgi:hypothetical protein|tara:strand:+ start:301 stop:597 length:297 start_codon:yes stop_codon:yes gene_type:complete